MAGAGLDQMVRQMFGGVATYLDRMSLIFSLLNDDSIKRGSPGWRLQLRICGDVHETFRSSCFHCLHRMKGENGTLTAPASWSIPCQAQPQIKQTIFINYIITEENNEEYITENKTTMLWPTDWNIAVSRHGSDAVALTRTSIVSMKVWNLPRIQTTLCFGLCFSLCFDPLDPDKNEKRK